MTDAWGASWGVSSAWGTSWAAGTAPAPTPGLDVGGRYVGKAFTRERWRKMQEAERALHAAEQRAIETEAVAKRAKILAATRKAEEALTLAVDTDISLAKLTAALEGAAAATKAATMATELRRITAAANAIIKAAEEEDEADIELLLLH